MVIIPGSYLMQSLNDTADSINLALLTKSFKSNPMSQYGDQICTVMLADNKAPVPWAETER
ncbi:MAG: hypothetical protein ACFCA4_06335 [Cyanophyceae cyanobacterium]